MNKYFEQDWPLNISMWNTPSKWLPARYSPTHHNPFSSDIDSIVNSLIPQLDNFLQKDAVRDSLTKIQKSPIHLFLFIHLEDIIDGHWIR